MRGFSIDLRLAEKFGSQTTTFPYDMERLQLTQESRLEAAEVDTGEDSGTMTGREA